jgi:hypothetical protein
MSAILVVAFFVFATLVLPTVQALVADDARGWLPHLSRALVRSAARRLPVAYQERYEEEWLALLSDWADRPLSAVVQAWSLRRGTRSLGFALCGERRATILDRLGAVVILTVFAPVLWAISITIVVTSPGGPAMFRIRRVDAFGRPYYLFRFRTFALDPGGLVVTGTQRPYTVQPTAFGAVLRRHGLHHLPYLGNVMRGDLPLLPEGASWKDVLTALWRDRRP